MIVADVEASGLDPRKHSIVSIGAIEFENPERRFYGECQIWNGAGIMADSLQVNGFTEEECRDSSKHTLEELMANFLHWIEQCDEKTLAGQNPSFDRDFINDSFARAHLNWHFAYRTLDLQSMAYMDMIKHGIPPPRKNDRTDLSTDTIFTYVGIPTEPKPHHGLTGALMEAEAFSRILHNKNLIPEFKEYPLVSR